MKGLLRKETLVKGIVTLLVLMCVGCFTVIKAEPRE